jgi:predicted DNA-binding WGR domain protein
MKKKYVWINEEKSRYYKIILQKDMLGDLILTSVWGGIYSNLGNYKHTLFYNINDADNFINQMMTHRSKRGYILLNNAC